MKLTKENFLEYFDSGKRFFIANQTKVDTCYPIKTENTYKNSGCFTIDQRVITFSRLHLIFNDYARDVLSNSVYTTYEEATEQMRTQFLRLIEHYNRHEFKNCPVQVMPQYTAADAEAPVQLTEKEFEFQRDYKAETPVPDEVENLTRILTNYQILNLENSADSKEELQEELENLFDGYKNKRVAALEEINNEYQKVDDYLFANITQENCPELNGKTISENTITLIEAYKKQGLDGEIVIKANQQAQEVDWDKVFANYNKLPAGKQQSLGAFIRENYTMKPKPCN